MAHTTIRGVTPSRWFSAGGQSVNEGSWPNVAIDRLPCGQQVVTSHLLFRIIPQHVVVFQPRIGSLCGDRQISYQISKLPQLAFDLIAAPSS